MVWKLAVFSTDPFRVLGLERATATQTDVKKAYAKLLKVTRPEDDRDAFMALRDAFEQARQIAPAQITALAEPVQPTQEALPDAQPYADTPAVEQVQWHHDAVLNWNFDTSPLGALTEQVIRWMVAGGPDAAKRVPEFAEARIGLAKHDADALPDRLIEFIFVAADPSEQRHKVPVWEPVIGTRPTWLSDDLIRVLTNDMGLLIRRPMSTYDARNYNTVQALFAPVASTDTPPQPIDVIDVFAKEQQEQRSDAHGSYFDRDQKEWIDMSPVGTAMRDLRAAFDTNDPDMVDTCAAILRREDIQSLDEYQQIDNLLRYHVLEASGGNSGTKRPTYPLWMTSSLLALFDETFGWSRHYGRHPWERQQYDWLHRVINRKSALVAAAEWERARQAPPRLPPQVPGFLQLFFARPRTLMISYISYRVVQALWRLAV